MNRNDSATQWLPYSALMEDAHVLREKVIRFRREQDSQD